VVADAVAYDATVSGEELELSGGIVPRVERRVGQCDAARLSDIALGDDLATPIAGSDSLLVIGDAAGAVYAVPRHRSGPVAPLAVFDGEPCP
jgi:hypothetical protein